MATDGAPGDVDDVHAGIDSPSTTVGGLEIELLVAEQMLRSARRRARLSQREVAERAGAPHSTVGRIESGQTLHPSMRMMQRLLKATGHYLVAVDRSGVPVGQHPHEDKNDRGGRYYPAHLDVETVNDPGDTFGPVWWWGWYRVAWWPDDPAVPRWTFVRIRNEHVNAPMI
jgi:transcriptional regulator with XRE-family HTH domain